MLINILMKQYSKINTFTTKPSPEQIVAYLISIIETTVFLAIVIPKYQHLGILIPICLLFTIFFIAKTIVGAWISFNDPSDEIMIQLRKQKNGEFYEKVSRESGKFLFCYDCQSFVQADSKHCRKCNRCVSGFDHHCKWINNCIGRQNYKSFVAMIFLEEAQLSIFLIGGSLLWAQGNWEIFLGQMIVVWVLMFIVGVFWLLILNLCVLHVYLICKGITTFQWLTGTLSKNQVQPVEESRDQREETEENLGIKKKKIIKYEENSITPVEQLSDEDKNMQKQEGKGQDVMGKEDKFSENLEVIFEGEQRQRRPRNRRRGKLSIKRDSVTVNMKGVSRKNSKSQQNSQKQTKSRSLQSLLTSVEVKNPLQIRTKKQIMPDFTL